MVSGSFSLPFRGAFHLSLTVLVHYRSLGSILPWEMVLPDSDGISRVPPYSGSTPEETFFQLQGCYLLWRIFPDSSFKMFLCNSNGVSYNPKETCSLVWAVSVSLAATWEIAFAFSSSRY